MVGALEVLEVALAGGDLDAAVGAHVVEGVELAGVVPRNDDRLAHDVEGHVVAGLLDLLGAGHGEPVLHKDLLLLEREDLGRGVDVGRQVVRLVERPPRLLEPECRSADSLVPRPCVRNSHDRSLLRRVTPHHSGSRCRRSTTGAP